MKLVIRVFAMLIVFAGLAAASVSSAPVPAASNHFGVTVNGPGPFMPGPPCPTCEPNLQHR